VPTHNKDAAFDKYEFFDGTKLISVEGRLATIDAIGEGASAVQIMRTYESLVRDLGGVKVFEGAAKDLENLGLKFSNERHRNSTWDEDQFGVYVVRLPDREVWVEAYISTYPTQQGHYYLTVVERKSLEVKASMLPAEEMKKELDAKGHVALYINFDFNRADIKPESQPIIDEVTKLLNTNPDLKLAVEGHTDNVGTPNYNRQLSEARARSVVSALTTRGIGGQRLKSAGYGQDKPIADNGSEEGRAKNRRVELVKMSA
jgi:outer membrane protein OmpA-like peptidoglycan-associated protein